jgi:VIT1/CCC1 family predicted Fe2+/Mn2+ transporter
MRHGHVEYHATSPEIVRDIVIGMSDGLTVPFALAAGLSGAHAPSHVVVLAGIAEIAAGSIAMGLGGYLAARTDEEHYESELQREIDETRELPDEETAEVRRVFQGWGLNDQQIEPIVSVICSDEKRWVDFMMKFELNLEAPDPKRALRSAATIAASYVVGGMIPLSPYMVTANVEDGLWWSVGVTIIALFSFGYMKGRFTGIRPLKGAAQTTLIGGLAAATAFGLARVFR